MDSIELLLVAAGGGLFCVALWRVVQLDRAAGQLEQALRRDAATLAEISYRKEAYARLQRAQRWSEALVDGSARGMRDLHLGLAGMTFRGLESVPVTPGTTRVLGTAHDLLSELVYGSILGINRVTGRYARYTLERTAKSRASHAEEAHDD